MVFNGNYYDKCARSFFYGCVLCWHVYGPVLVVFFLVSVGEKVFEKKEVVGGRVKGKE